MSNLWRGVENRGIRKGRAEGRVEEKLNAIKSLMKKLNFTMEPAIGCAGCF